jgi:hypothetical protein
MDTYEKDRIRILNRIEAQKNIHKFRMFMYSISKEQRQILFNICVDYFVYELDHKVDMKVSENELLGSMVNHFQWYSFENDSMNWWGSLSRKYANSETLHIFIRECIRGWNGMEMSNVIVDTQSTGLR